VSLGCRCLFPADSTCVLAVCDEQHLDSTAECACRTNVDRHTGAVSTVVRYDRPVQIHTTKQSVIAAPALAYDFPHDFLPVSYQLGPPQRCRNFASNGVFNVLDFVLYQSDVVFFITVLVFVLYCQVTLASCLYSSVAQ